MARSNYFTALAPALGNPAGKSKDSSKSRRRRRRRSRSKASHG